MAVRSSQVEDLYEQTRAPLARSVGRIVGDEAQDLVHEAFVSYLQHGQDVLQPEAWLGRVARNKALNQVRRGGVVALVDDKAGDDDPTASIDRSALAPILSAAMAALPARSAQALRLRFYDDVSYEQIGLALGCTEAQARVVVHRSIKRLGRRVVTMFAAHSGAEACVPALERMVGVHRADVQHAEGPCKDCRTAWDELSALRWLPGIFPFGFREALARLGARVRELPTAVPAAVAALGLVIGAGLGSAPSQGPSDPTPRRVEPVVATGPEEIERVRPLRLNPTASDSVASVDEPVRTQERTAARVGPVSVKKGDRTTRVVVKDAPEEGGVAACEPLQPCRPEFASDP